MSSRQNTGKVSNSPLAELQREADRKELKLFVIRSPVGKPRKLVMNRDCL